MSMIGVPLKTVIWYHADSQNEVISADGWEKADGRTLTSGQQDINPGGTYTLPDLRNVVILGADITAATAYAGDFSVAGAGGAPGPKGTGGSNSKSLSSGELAAHTHTGTSASSGAHTHAGSSLATAGAHTHSGSGTDSVGAHSHTINDSGHTHGAAHGSFVTMDSNQGSNVTNTMTGGGQDDRNQGTSSSATGITINSAGTHSHVLTIVSDGSHTHTVTVASDGAHTHTFTTDSTGSGTAFDKRPRFYGLVALMKVKI